MLPNGRTLTIYECPECGRVHGEWARIRPTDDYVICMNHDPTGRPEGRPLARPVKVTRA